MEIKKPSLKDTELVRTKSTPRLKPEMYDALNGQVVIELNTVSLFQSMYACTEAKGFSGASIFFQDRVKEEQMHVNKVYQYMLDKGMHPITPIIQAPTFEYIDLYDIIESCREYQVGVTQSYEKIGELAISLGDHTTYSFIQFFLEDQIKEEATFITLCDQYKTLAIGGMTGLAWMKLDKLMGNLVKD